MGSHNTLKTIMYLCMYIYIFKVDKYKIGFIFFIQKKLFIYF